MEGSGMNLSRSAPVWAAAMFVVPASAFAQFVNHLGPGAQGPGMPPTKLFTADYLFAASGHGPIVGPDKILPITRNVLTSSYAQPRFGGYAFATSGFNDL